MGKERKEMNPEKEIFEPVTTDMSENWFRITVGQECEIAGIKCKVWKVTRKDIVCRPIDFKQKKGEKIK